MTDWDWQGTWLSKMESLVPRIDILHTGSCRIRLLQAWALYPCKTEIGLWQFTIILMKKGHFFFFVPIHDENSNGIIASLQYITIKSLIIWFYVAKACKVTQNEMPNFLPYSLFLYYSLVQRLYTGQCSWRVHCRSRREYRRVLATGESKDRYIDFYLQTSRQKHAVYSCTPVQGFKCYIPGV